MIVADLKRIIAIHDDSEEVMYFDSEAGEDISMRPNWISFKEGKNEYKKKVDEKYLYDIILDGKFVGDQGNNLFNTREEAQTNADGYIISELKWKYRKKYQDFEVIVYPIQI